MRTTWPRLGWAGLAGIRFLTISPSTMSQQPSIATSPSPSPSPSPSSNRTGRTKTHVTPEQQQKQQQRQQHRSIVNPRRDDHAHGRGDGEDGSESVDEEDEEEENGISKPFLASQQSHYHPNYPISTVMNQVSTQNITSTALNAIKSSIPITLKPPPLTSFVKLGYINNLSPSALTPANKRSTPSPIKLSRSPSITLSQFQPYLDQVKVQFERWQSNLIHPAKLISSDRQATIATSITPTTTTFDRSSSTKPPSLSSIPHVFFDQKFSLTDPLTFDLLTQQQQQQPSSSSSKPSTSNPSSPLKLQSTDPSTSQVTNHKPLSNSIANLTTDHVLLDKLSHYLDLVELHLVQEISLRSSSFFSALGNLQSLHAQTSSSVAQIEALKHQLDQLNQTIAVRALQIIRYGTRRKNISNLELALSKLSQVWQTVHEIDQMIQSGEWQSALGLIEELESLWRSTTPLSSSDAATTTTTTTDPGDLPAAQIKFRLSKIKALASLPKRLSVFRSTISKALEAELNSILSYHLKTNLTQFANCHLPEPSNRSKAIKSPSSPVHDHIKREAQDKLKERVRSTFDGLIRAGGSDKALATWREDLIKQIREIVKNALSDMIEGDVDDKDDALDVPQLNPNDQRTPLSDRTMTLAHKLQALNHSQFLKIAQETFRNLLGCIELVDTQFRALLELLQDFKTHSTLLPDSSRPIEFLPDSNSTINPIQSDLTGGAESSQSVNPAIDVEAFSLKFSEIVQACAEIANARFAKVIGVRTEIHAQLSFKDFFVIFDASWKFVVQCEVISRRMIIALRGVMVGQAKAFLQSFHQSKITESAKIVEQEQWSPVEVPNQVQQIVNAIISSAMEDPKALIITPNDDLPLSPAGDQGHQTNSLSQTKLLDVEGTPYHPVSASLETLKTIADYLSIVINCSLLTTDLMAKIIEFLKAFNSRTCQVVLGAGAIRSAGLKNITAKHLALASQALSTMINLIPYIRECIRRHLNMKQAVMLIDFDKLKRDFQEHQNEIHAKLISIMADRLAIHKQTLQSIDWESLNDSTKADQDTTGSAPNAYLENLIKEVVTLHRVLGRYLSTSTLQDIMSQVFSAIHAVLAEEFGQIEPKSIQAKDSLLRDARFFSIKLNEMKATEQLQADAKTLEEMVQKKRLPKGLSIIHLSSTEPKSPTKSEPLSPSPSLAEQADSFRAKFRFLSPRERPSSSIPADVSESTSPTEDISTNSLPNVETGPSDPGTAYQTQASPSNQEDDAIQGDQQAELGPPLHEGGIIGEAALSCAPADSQVVADLDSAALISDKEDGPSRSTDVVNTTLSPPPSTTSQPHKLTLSQRLAALASNRRGSYPLSSSSSPTLIANHQSPTAGSDIPGTPSISSVPIDLASVPTEVTPISKDLDKVSSPTPDDQIQNDSISDNNPLVKHQPTPRMSFKERLAAIAAKAASTSIRPIQSVEPVHKPLTPEEGLEAKGNSEGLERLEIAESSGKKMGTVLLLNDSHHDFLSLEELKNLPALPPSPSVILTDYDVGQCYLEQLQESGPSTRGTDEKEQQDDDNEVEEQVMTQDSITNHQSTDLDDNSKGSKQAEGGCDGIEENQQLKIDQKKKKRKNKQKKK